MPTAAQPTSTFVGLTGRVVHTASAELAESVYPSALVQPRHGHDPAYFTVVLSGAYRETIAHRTGLVRAGTVLFHEPGEEHAVEFVAPETRILRVLPSAPMIESARLAGVDLGRAQSPDVTTARRAAARLARDVAVGEPLSTLGIEEALCDLIVACRAGASCAPSDAVGAMRARDAIEAALTSPPSLATLARIAGCHPVTLTRAFRRTFGCAIGAYVRRRRLQLAGVLLRSGNDPIAMVAAEAGFADQAHLTRELRRHTGTTPAALRRAR